MKGMIVYAVENEYWHHIDGGACETVDVYMDEVDAQLACKDLNDKFAYEDPYSGTCYRVNQYTLK